MLRHRGFSPLFLKKLQRDRGKKPRGFPRFFSAGPRVFPRFPKNRSGAAGKTREFPRVSPRFPKKLPGEQNIGNSRGITTLLPAVKMTIIPRSGGHKIAIPWSRDRKITMVPQRFFYRGVDRRKTRDITTLPGVPYLGIHCAVGKTASVFLEITEKTIFFAPWEDERHNYFRKWDEIPPNEKFSPASRRYYFYSFVVNFVKCLPAAPLNLPIKVHSWYRRNI